jgi:hypothetical protein
MAMKITAARLRLAMWSFQDLVLDSRFAAAVVVGVGEAIDDTAMGMSERGSGVEAALETGELAPVMVVWSVVGEGRAALMESIIDG